MEPNNNKSITAKFFFLSLSSLIALIASVSAFLTLAFQILNKKFPDVLNSAFTHGYNTYDFEGIRGALALLIIVFPIYLALTYFWSKAIKQNLTHADDIVRKWMIYLVLFLSGIVLVVDLVTLVKYFVAGEITTRFILKVLVTILAAGLVGKYYLSLIGVIKIRPRLLKIFPIISSLLILLLIIFSFMTIGSPKEQRDFRLDQRRVENLESIQYQVINYWQQKGKIPESLNELADPISSFMIPVDPEGRLYEYKKTGDMSFELCATFSRAIPKGWQENGYGTIRPMMGGFGKATDIAVSYPYPGGKADSWDHEAGRTCFARTIDKDLYPVYPKDQRF